MKELADGGSERALGGDPCAAASADQTTAAKNTSNRDTTFTEEPFCSRRMLNEEALGWPVEERGTGHAIVQIAII